MEENQAVTGSKGKKRKKDERNEKSLKEIKHSGVKEDVIEKGKEMKKKKKKKVNMDNEQINKDDLMDHGSDLKIKKKIEGTKNNLKGERKKKKEKKKSMEDLADKIIDSENPKAKKTKKKVRFSGEVRVENEKLVQGKRFTPEENEILKEAVYNYIEEHALGEKGLNMVLNCRSHPKISDCWNHIAKAIPYRPKTSIYNRANRLFRQGDKRKWTEEECELILNFQKNHGNKWKVLAEEFGRHEIHVRNAWTRIKSLNRKKGKWSHDEYQNLFDLVNIDLQLKLTEEKKSKHGMLRDNIHWAAISDKMTTRPEGMCCQKWYYQLTSPMVGQGLWADVDDYRLISELYRFDATCIEDLDWDNVLEHRSGDICRKRWNQMVVCIEENGRKTFSEQVDILAKRYCPHLLEVREDWDNKPFVDED